MLTTAVLVRLNELTNRTFVLPVLVFFPTSRCNSRCVSCDWWKTSGDNDLRLDEVARLATDLRTLGTRIVLFSGGEPLLRPEVFQMARLFAAAGVELHLHTSGVLLERLADEVADHFTCVIVSLDAAEETGYRAIRGVNALATLERGVARLRALVPAMPITARSTIHRLNFRELPQLVLHARAMGLDGISFLPADVSARAFGREAPVDDRDLALSRAEVMELADIVDETISAYPEEFESGFIAESPTKLRRIPQYYGALAGIAPFPSVQCNAPYMSVVVEADGRVRPCFFHEPVGSIREASLSTIVSGNLRAFRSTLSVPDDRVCERCVCSMKTTLRSAPWL